MIDWSELPEQLRLQLTTASLGTAALMLASLADAIASEIAITGRCDSGGNVALRRLAAEFGHQHRPNGIGRSGIRDFAGQFAAWLRVDGGRSWLCVIRPI